MLKVVRAALIITLFVAIATFMFAQHNHADHAKAAKAACACCAHGESTADAKGGCCDSEACKKNENGNCTAECCKKDADGKMACGAGCCDKAKKAETADASKGMACARKGGKCCGGAAKGGTQ